MFSIGREGKATVGDVEGGLGEVFLLVVGVEMNSGLVKQVPSVFAVFNTEIASYSG